MDDNIYVVNEYRSDGTELWKKNGASYTHPRSSGTGYSAVQYWYFKIVERRVYEKQNRTEYDIQIIERVGSKDKKEFFKKYYFY